MQNTASHATSSQKAEARYQVPPNLSFSFVDNSNCVVPPCSCCPDMIHSLGFPEDLTDGLDHVYPTDVAICWAIGDFRCNSASLCESVKRSANCAYYALIFRLGGAELRRSEATT